MIPQHILNIVYRQLLKTLKLVRGWGRLNASHNHTFIAPWRILLKTEINALKLMIPGFMQLYGWREEKSRVRVDNCHGSTRRSTRQRSWEQKGNTLPLMRGRGRVSLIRETNNFLP
jgi:hypothetical protein